MGRRRIQFFLSLLCSSLCLGSVPSVTLWFVPPMIRVNLGPRSYDIAIVGGDAAGLGPFARDRCPAARAFVAADEHVFAHAEAAARSLHAAGFQPTLATVS